MVHDRDGEIRYLVIELMICADQEQLWTHHTNNKSQMVLNNLIFSISEEPEWCVYIEEFNVSNSVCLLLIAFLYFLPSRCFPFTSFKIRIPLDLIRRIYPIFLSIMRQKLRTVSILNRFIYQGGSFFSGHRAYSIGVLRCIPGTERDTLHIAHRHLSKHT